MAWASIMPMGQQLSSGDTPQSLPIAGTARPPRKLGPGSLFVLDFKTAVIVIGGLAAALIWVRDVQHDLTDKARENAKAIADVSARVDTVAAAVGSLAAKIDESDGSLTCERTKSGGLVCKRAKP